MHKFSIKIEFLIQFFVEFKTIHFDANTKNVALISDQVYSLALEPISATYQLQGLEQQSKGVN